MAFDVCMRGLGVERERKTKNQMPKSNGKAEKKHKTLIRIRMQTRTYCEPAYSCVYLVDAFRLSLARSLRHTPSTRPHTQIIHLNSKNETKKKKQQNSVLPPMLSSSFSLPLTVFLSAHQCVTFTQCVYGHKCVCVLADSSRIDDVFHHLTYLVVFLHIV